MFRKLPSLDDSFSENPRSTDYPTLHQGRKRTQPHVAGQWAAHVYVDLELDPTLRKTLRNVLATVKAAPAGDRVHVSFNPDTEAGDMTLHISLTRPLYLQTNQKADLCAAVAKVASAFKGFSARYASFGMLENDEKTRKFLAVEIGQGYQQLKDVVRKLDDELESMRLPRYYDSPRFHTSIAWTSVESNDDTDGPANHLFAEAQLDALEADFGKRLRQDELWVDELVLKIGKDVTRYRLSRSPALERA
ncbi:hypothetical protein JCM11491_002999 [Sporobolomyces phaffii]